MKRALIASAAFAMSAALQAPAVAAQRQSFDKYVPSRGGIRVEANHEVKAKLGFADPQRFSQSLLDAVSRVASTSIGNDCGEGFAVTPECARVYAQLAAARR